MQKTETAKEKADRLLEKSRVLQAEKEKEVSFYICLSLDISSILFITTIIITTISKCVYDYFGI